MAILINIGFWVLLIYAAVISFFAGKRYKKLRSYTYWIEQSLLEYRPETYIPEWRKQQREKDGRKKSHPDQNHVPNPDTTGNKTIDLNKLLRNTLRY
jgi:hypothetical protein